MTSSDLKWVFLCICYLEGKYHSFSEIAKIAEIDIETLSIAMNILANIKLIMPNTDTGWKVNYDTVINWDNWEKITDIINLPVKTQAYFVSNSKENVQKFTEKCQIVAVTVDSGVNTLDNTSHVIKQTYADRMNLPISEVYLKRAYDYDELFFNGEAIERRYLNK